MAMVNRDSFAREELHCERVYTEETCTWCGQSLETRNGRKYLRQYRIETDGGRTSDIRGLFCCKACLDAYHR